MKRKKILYKKHKIENIIDFVATIEKVKEQISAKTC